MKQQVVQLKNRLIAIRFFRFFLSGGLSFCVDTAVLILIKSLVFSGVDVKLLGTISIAKLVSGTFGIIVMFTLNRSWVFSESKEQSLKKQSAKYLAVTLVNLLIASILYGFFSGILSQVFPFEYLIHVSLFVVIANLLTEATKMIISFFAYKYLVFR